MKSKPNKCIKCLSRLGKRYCIKFNQLICQRCCGSIRNAKDCPITCKFFPNFPEPEFLVKGGELSAWETGDLIQMSDFLFLPNMYQYVDFELLNFDLFFSEPQKLDITVEFCLKKNFTTDVEDILCKESWKRDMYPHEDDMETLYPLIGIAVPGRGLYSLTKENIKLIPSKILKGSVTHRIIVNPNQRGLVLGRKSPSNVNFISVRNLFIFGRLFFDTPYTLKMTLFEASTYLNDKNLLNTVIGLIIPFGSSKIINPTIIPPPGFSTTFVDNSTFSPIKSKYYPGESPNGLSFIPIKGKEEVIMGKRITFYPGMHNNDTLVCIWGIDNRTSSNIAISILDHDIFINPLLFSIFKKFYGNIAFPIHLNVINLEDSKELSVKCTDLTSGKNWTENIVAPRKSEITIPLSVSELSKVKPGKKPIEIVVSDATNILYVKNIELNILPPDHLLLRIHDVGHSWYRDTLDAIVCWVSPNNKKIEELISDTLNRLGNDFFQ